MDEEPNGRSQQTIPLETLFGYFVTITACAIVATSVFRFGNGASFVTVLTVLALFYLWKDF